MNNDYYVYRLIAEGQTDPFYVGKGRELRAWHHMMPSNLSNNSHKSNTIKKCFRNGLNVLVEMICTGLCESDSLRIEVWCIHLYGRKDKGEGCLTNQTNGGDGVSGFVHSDIHKETTAKRSMGNTYRRGAKCSDESRDRMKIAKSQTSDETRARMSIAKIGTKVAYDVVRKRADKLVGKKQTIVYCDICHTKCSPATLSRWHNDKCKFKDNEYEKIS